MILTMTFQLFTGDDNAIPAVKEALAMTLEKWGDVKLLWVGEAPEQMTIGGVGP